MCETSTARNNGLISRAKETFGAFLGLFCFFIIRSPLFALWLIWFKQRKRVNDACAMHVAWDHCQRLELPRRGQWLNQSGGPAPAPESRESVPPSHILRALRIAGCDRDNCESFRSHYRDRSGACPLHSSMCGPAWA